MPPLAEHALLETIGARLRAWRLARNITQADLAAKAGVARRTLQSLEDGHSVQLGTFLRVMRELGLLDTVDAVVSEPGPSPLELVARDGKRRQRASSAAPEPKTWQWGDET